VVSNGDEITLRSRVIWNQAVVLLSVIASGWLNGVSVYGQPQGGQPLFYGEVIPKKRLTTKDSVLLTAIQWMPQP
jgi:hypothetical protein